MNGTVRNPWNPGETLVVRGIWKGRLWWACPAYVVRHTPQLLAVYWRAGTSVRRWVHRPTVEEMLTNRPELIDSHWTDTDVLSLLIPGAGFSIDLMWEAGMQVLRCWYVHLQEPFRPTQVGFDTMDQILDIVIHPDRSEWRWKDEDEFSQAESLGVYSVEQVRHIRAEGERVIRMLDANASPFCDGWERWTPPAEWGIPSFPAGWEDRS